MLPLILFLFFPWRPAQTVFAGRDERKRNATDRERLCSASEEPRGPRRYGAWARRMRAQTPCAAVHERAGRRRRSRRWIAEARTRGAPKRPSEAAFCWPRHNDLPGAEGREAAWSAGMRGQQNDERSEHLVLAAADVSPQCQQPTEGRRGAMLPASPDGRWVFCF